MRRSWAQYLENPQIVDSESGKQVRELVLVSRDPPIAMLVA